MLAGGSVKPMGGKVIERPKRRRKIRDYSHLKCGSIVDGKWVNDFSLCMHCGGPLPPNEDGSAKFRKFPEPCDECIWANDEGGE